MKQTFLKLGLFLALGLTAAVFTSCGDDSESNGNGNENTNGNGNAGNPFTGTWTRDGSNGSITVEFTGTTWTAKSGNSIYNSGTYIYDGNTAVLKVSNKGIGNANVGETGSATISNNQMTVSNFSDGNMNGQFTKESSGGNGNQGGNTGDPLTITASNVLNSSSQVATVKIWIETIDDREILIAQAPYKNNGFTVELPETLPDSYLYTQFQDEEWNNLTISDRNAKTIAESWVGGYDSNGNEIGEFWASAMAITGEDDDVMGWIYVDRDVTIKGEIKEVYDEWDEEYISKYDLNLKKGWNIVYGTETESYDSETGRNVYTWSLTSQKPAGLTYLWYFEDYGDYRSSKTTKPEQKAAKWFIHHNKR
ncbi:MAG: hypothetical protein LBR81_04240 [Prevotellaceae bacterium]|jgi:hypothetical protein|nr:hypothetical protein [Prevotellaceae bacterium]